MSTLILHNATVFHIIRMVSQMLMLGLLCVTFDAEGTKVLVSIIMSQPVNMVKVKEFPHVFVSKIFSALFTIPPHLFFIAARNPRQVRWIDIYGRRDISMRRRVGNLGTVPVKELF